MQKKFYAFLIFPGAHGRLHKIQLPFYLIHMLLALSAVGIMTVAALANSYARMLLKVSNYNNVRSEREALKTQYRTLESAVTSTNAKLDSLQSLATEVALTYGFGDERRPRFPSAVLALATQTNASVDSSFRASLYAFNLIRRASLDPDGNDLGRGMFSNPLIARTAVPSLWPVRGQITAGFGQRMDPFSGEGAFHAGVDISVPFGTRVECCGRWNCAGSWARVGLWQRNPDRPRLWIDNQVWTPKQDLRSGRPSPQTRAGHRRSGNDRQDDGTTPSLRGPR